MALEIRSCPVLTGKDAERFRWRMNNQKPISEEVKQRMRRNYEAIMAISKLPK